MVASLAQALQAQLSLDSDETRESQEHLVPFIERVRPGYRAAPHHRHLARVLEAVERGERRFIIITMPPRHGKSEMASVHFPPWYLGRHPNRRVILASYGASLAQMFSRRARAVVQSEQWPFPYRTSGDLAQVERWDIERHKGGLIAAGIGGAITGQGADLFIVDDPVRNAKDALSATVRESTWEWFTSTAFTRLQPNGAMVVIGTRWHEDDLIGRILKGGTSEKWELVNFPAIAERADILGRLPGQALWPEQYNLEALEEIHEQIGTRAWTSLYQQRPAPAEGAVFLRPWWRFWHPNGQDFPAVSIRSGDGTVILIPSEPLPPVFDETIQSWDMAFKSVDDGSYVVGQTWSRAGSRAYLRAQRRERLNFPSTVAAVEREAMLWPDARARLIEDAANGPAVLATLSSRISGLIAVPPRGSKLERANAVSSLVEAGNVYLPHPEIAPWVGAFIEELADFPNGENDDQVDAASQALARMLHPKSGTIREVIAQSVSWASPEAPAAWSQGW